MICGDPDSGDRYVGVVARDLPEWATAENPVCRIKGILRYPIQHALIMDVEHERPPLKTGGLYTLRVFERIRKEDAPEDRGPEALRTALAACRASERGILERHLAGDVRGTRAIRKWEEWEL